MIGKRITEKLIIPLGGGPPSCDLLDSYSESYKNNADDLKAVHPTATNYTTSAFGQSFQMGASNKKICKAKFYLTRQGVPVGNLKAVLYASTLFEETCRMPTGDALALSDAVSMSIIETEGVFQLVEFTFTGDEKYEMQASTIYCIEVIVSDATTIDETNYIQVGWDDSEPTHDGSMSWYSQDEDPPDPAQWLCDPDVDVCFYVYGEAV